MPSKKHSHNKKSSANKTHQTHQQPITLPENFQSVVCDFAKDLINTFPETTPILERWTVSEIPEPVLQELFSYFANVYPERFFDILYQNEEIFQVDNQANTAFFPNLDFKNLYYCTGVTETIQAAIWKYLQLMMITILGSIRDKSMFGETAGMFNGVDESVLQEKLGETIGEISKFFQNLGEFVSEENTKSNNDSEQEQQPPREEFSFDPSGSSIPNAEDLHEHLKGLFDGKIGSLAKEMAEELSKDMADAFGINEDSNIESTQDVIKKMLKNPKKIMDIMKSIGSKLNEKMKKGEISEQEIMKEAGDLMNKMKDIGGGKNEFASMFQNLAKNMGMGGGKMNMGAFQQMSKKFATKERMATKLDQKRAQKQTESVFSDTKLNNNVFSVDGDEFQEKSTRRPLHEMELDDLVNTIENAAAATAASSSSKKKNNKHKNKGKKPVDESQPEAVATH